MRLTIIGASGHGKVAADIAARCGYDHIEFLDDDETITQCGIWPVVGTTNKQIKNDYFVAIGNAAIRKKLIEKFKGNIVATLIHPQAIIADDVKIGSGSIVMAGAVINPGAIIGEGCIINTSSSVDHDCNVGDYAHISVGAHLSGTVDVGKKTWIGAGAVVSNNIRVCDECMIGAGAVVIKNIDEPGTYIGVPAKKAK